MHASGPASPIQTLSGQKTGLAGFQGLQQIAIDPLGNMWALNITGSVAEFRNDATGNIAPEVSIGGLSTPVAAAFDHQGNLYVAEFVDPGVVQVFRPP